MDNSFLAYIQQLEILAFFSGYPLVYAMVIALAKNNKHHTGFKSRVVSVLPFSYALVATLFLGFQVKKAVIGYAISNSLVSFQPSWLMIWGLLGVLFWIPAFAKNTVVSLLHSVVFFLFIVWDIFVKSNLRAEDGNLLGNDMKIYTASLLLNAVTFGVMVAVFFIRYKRGRNNRVFA